MHETEPVIEYYRGRGILHEVDGIGSREEVLARRGSGDRAVGILRR